MSNLSSEWLIQGVGTRVSLKVATNGPLEVKKKPWRLTFWCYHSKKKENDQSNSCLFDHSGIFIPSSATSILHIEYMRLVPTKCFFRYQDSFPAHISLTDFFPTDFNPTKGSLKTFTQRTVLQRTVPPRTVTRMDISPTNSSPIDFSPNRHFPESHSSFQE